MNRIISINQNTISIFVDELSITAEVPLELFARNADDNKWLELSSDVLNIENPPLKIVSGYSLWGPVLYQQLWQNYMNSEMDLSEVQTEATDRSISTSGKTQDQLARSIIQYECSSHGTDYLLSVEGMSMSSMKVEGLSVESPKKSPAKTTSRKKKK